MKYTVLNPVMVIIIAAINETKSVSESKNFFTISIRFSPSFYLICSIF